MDLLKLAKAMELKKAVRHRRKYDKEFKEEVLKMVLNGRPVREVSESLGIGENIIYRWKNQAGGTLPSLTTTSDAHFQGTVSAKDHEQVKAKLREVEQERDILKKALGIFNRGN